MFRKKQQLLLKECRKMYTLSVIIPNYNNAKYIEQCLESVVRQIHIPDEIIIIDDCSSDKSVELIRNFSKSHSSIRLVCLDQNQGVSHARNIGLAQASSEYVTFLDGDDFYYSDNKLKKEMSLIQRYREKGTDIIAYSAYKNVDALGREAKSFYNQNIYAYQFIKGYALVNLLLKNKNRRIPRDYCVKKSVLIECGAYSCEEDFYEDLDLLYRLAVSRVRFFPNLDWGTAYRRKEGGLSSRPKQDHIAAVEKITQCYYVKMNRFEQIEYWLKRVIWKTLSACKKLVR